MDSAERRFQWIAEIAVEIIQRDELLSALDSGQRLVAYDGFEPSGLCHLPLGVYRPLLIQNLLAAGIEFKLLLADTFGWINNKMGGDLTRIRRVGEYFVEVWKAAGVPMDRVEVVWHKDLFDDPEYWRKVILIAKSHTVQRSSRSLAIAGRLSRDENPMAFLFYPSMQCADIFQLDANICQLGLDQRKVNILAREVAQTLGWRKPICVHHQLLPGLQGPAHGEGAFDENQMISDQIAGKMSKSRPETAIFVHDSLETIQRKIAGAYCPAGGADDNPILAYAREIIFRKFGKLIVERSAEHGGDVAYSDYVTLESDFVRHQLHPADLKPAVARALDTAISPIRRHFEVSGQARQLLEDIQAMEVSR